MSPCISAPPFKLIHFKFENTRRVNFDSSCDPFDSIKCWTARPKNDGFIIHSFFFSRSQHPEHTIGCQTVWQFKLHLFVSWIKLCVLILRIHERLVLFSLFFPPSAKSFALLFNSNVDYIFAHYILISCNKEYWWTSINVKIFSIIFALCKDLENENYC